MLVVDEEGLDVAGVEVAGALGLRQDEVEEEEEAEGGVEREVGEERKVGLQKEEEGKGGPVLEPGDQEGGGGGAKGFVGEVEGKEDRDNGTGEGKEG